MAFLFFSSKSKSSFCSLITNSLASAAGKTTLIAGPGAQNVGVSLTNAQINGSLTRLWTQYRGVNNSAGLVSVARAADIEADDSGQYGCRGFALVRILVTGATGFIGSHLLNAACEALGSENVMVLSSKPSRLCSSIVYNDRDLNLKTPQHQTARH